MNKGIREISRILSIIIISVCGILRRSEGYSVKKVECHAQDFFFFLQSKENFLLRQARLDQLGDSMY